MELMALVPHERSWTENGLNGPRIVHNCEVPEEPDEIDAFLTGSGLFHRLRRWVLRKSVLSAEHPIARTCLKSTAAINYEISRQIRSHPYRIHPFSRLRYLWETSMTIFTALSLVLVPLALAFDFAMSGFFFSVIFTTDALFALDITMTLFTGRYDKSTRVIILDRKIVVEKYLKGRFLLDALSCLPIPAFYLIFDRSESPKWYWTISELTKLFRLHTVVRYSRNLRHLYSVSFHKYKIFEMTVILTICIHWATCLELYVALVAREIDWKNKNQESWLMSDSIKDKDTDLKMYLVCANRATISLVGSAHHLNVKTTEDMLLNMILTIVGRIGIIYIIAYFLQRLTIFQSRSKRKVKKLHELEEFMKCKELPRGIQRRLLDYSNFCSKKSFERNKHIIASASPQLREELLLHNYSRLVNGVEIFRHLAQPLLGQVVGLVRTEVYLTNDTLVKAGTPDDALFFIASGTLAIFTSEEHEISHLEEGSYFGEVSLVMKDEKRTATVVAVEISEVWTLKRDDFLHSLSPYPSLLTRLQKIAVGRLEKHLLADANSNFHRVQRGEFSDKEPSL